MTTEQIIIETLKPLLEKAVAIDPRISNLCILLDYPIKENAEIYANFSGLQSRGSSGYGIEKALEGVKPYDPKAEKQAAIEKLRAELAELENNRSTNKK